MTDPEIDRRLSEITRLMLLGTATAHDESEYQELVVTRAKRMVREVPPAFRGGLRRCD